MERVVQSVEVPCRFAKNGCTEKIVLLQQEMAREFVSARAMLLPRARLQLHRASGGTAGPFHRLPQVAVHGVRDFEYYVQFDLRLQLGPHVLRAQDGTVFLMNVVAAEPLGHAISLVCVRAPPRSGALWCIRASQATTRSRRWTP
jgi:E3 ubiquitin-protein ligase SIAH1